MPAALIPAVAVREVASGDPAHDANARPGRDGGDPGEAGEQGMLRRVGRVLEELPEGRSGGGAIVPELPSRRDHWRRRRELGATPKAARGAARAARLRAVHPEDGGGSLPAPFSAQTRRTGERMTCPKGNGDKGFRAPPCVREAAKGAAKGGCRPFAAKCRPRKLRNGWKKAAPASPCPQPSCRRGRTATATAPQESRSEDNAWLTSPASRPAAPGAQPVPVP